MSTHAQTEVRHAPQPPLALLLLAALAACAETSTLTDPDDPGTTQTGSLTVSAITNGDDLDDDGYTATVGTATQTVGANASVTFNGLPAGPVSVSLSGVADNCAAREVSPLTVPVVGGETTEQTFNVTCEPLAQAEGMTLVAADRTGNIWIVDEATGQETLLNHTPQADDGLGGTQPLGVISSMAWIPSTDAWWMGMGGNSVCVNRGCVYVRDTIPTSPTFGLYNYMIEDSGLYAVAGLAVRPTDGSIYTFEADGSGPLMEMDPITADTSIVFDNLAEGSSGKGTTFGPDGLLYVSGRQTLSVVDVDAQTITPVGTYTFTGFPPINDTSPTIGSMATRESDGTVFGILKDGGGGGSTTATYLVTINLQTAELTNVGLNTNRPGRPGLHPDPTGRRATELTPAPSMT